VVRFLEESRDFPLCRFSTPSLLATQSPVELVPGVLSPGIKKAGCELDHLPTGYARS
jgi:hypothetical protein